MAEKQVKRERLPEKELDVSPFSSLTRNPLVGVKSTKDVTVDLAHWAHTCVCYDSFVGGYPLLHLLPELPLGHGIKLRVTVEVLDQGTPCPVRRWNDTGCTKKRTRKAK